MKDKRERTLLTRELSVGILSPKLLPIGSGPLGGLCCSRRINSFAVLVGRDLFLFFEKTFMHFPFVWKAEAQRWRGQPCIGLLPKWPQELALGQAECKSMELHLGVPLGLWGPKRWSHHLLSPRLGISRKLVSRTETGPDPTLWEGLQVCQVVT